MRGKPAGMKVGDVYETNNFGRITITDYVNHGYVVVKFEDDTTVTTRTSHIFKGQVKNPNQPNVYGVGFIGQGNYSPKTHPKEYIMWRGMLQRSCDSNCHKLHPTYIGCTVCSRWHNFQFFCEDISQMIGYENLVNGWQLDKDILFFGNKEYSGKRCCLVPSIINSVFTKNDVDRGDCPIGVSINPKSETNPFMARCHINGDLIYLGCFTTKIKAFYAYKIAKEAEIQRLANLHKKQLDPRVYQALMDYEVCWDD